ncbi:MAG TPA: hypothetical protein VGP07_18955 [Polyangia bacterium]|jgi:hypothetical protein
MPKTRALIRRYGVWTAGLALTLGACNSGDGSQATGQLLPSDVSAVVFLQRAPRNSGGNVFDYASYVAGAGLMKLEPPSPNGKLTDLTAVASASAATTGVDFTGADIMAWDLSFDAKQIAFSARLANEQSYQIFTMSVDGANPTQVTAGDNDYVFPVFLPGQKLLFMTNQSVETGASQFEDEYERATTAQVGTINLDGTNMQLGPRNVSHRVAPTLLPDGHVLYTEWRHLGDVNDGHLRMMNADMTGMKEAYGSELQPSVMVSTNSYLRARYVSTYQTDDGTTAYKVVAVGTSRDRTLQAGKLLMIDLAKSEATSFAVDMTKSVPGDRGDSTDGVGRYYDAEPIGTPAGSKFLVSWADGPVESETLAAAKVDANFGLYVFDAASGGRNLLYDNPNMWEVQARPLSARIEPPITASPVQGDSFVVSAINVNDTSLTDIQAGLNSGAAVKVRLIEGFSGEEGIRTFGSTEFDGASLYGEVPVYADGSFKAQVPANVPVHMQVIDKFALSLATEDIWISGRGGEQRTCGGCHENRSKPLAIQPGQTMAGAQVAVNLDVPRAQRSSTNFTYGNVRGVPWDTAIQPIFDAKCVSCHDGDATKPGNPQFTVMDNTVGKSQTFTFDLTGNKLPITVGERMTGDFTASYISIFGLGELLGDDNVTITPPDGEFNFGNAADAAGSTVIQMLNPVQQFPVVDATVHRCTSAGNCAKNLMGLVHTTEKGVPDLTPGEYYLLGLSIDMGGQFFSRENRDEVQGQP